MDGKAAKALAGGAVDHLDARYEARRGRPRAAERAVGDTGRVENRPDEVAHREPPFQDRRGRVVRAGRERGVPALSDARRFVAVRDRPRDTDGVSGSHGRIHDESDARSEGPYELAEPERGV